MTSADSLVQRARDLGNPVVQNNRATFFWEGDSAPLLVGDLTHWDERPKLFKRLTTRLNPSSNKVIWFCSLRVPRDAYVEYAFQDPVTLEQFLDPWNRCSISNGVGGRNNFF